MNKLKELSKKKWFIVLVIVLLITLVGGLGTYAMLYWRSAQNTEITLKIGDIADVTFPQGQELNTNNLTPVFNYTDGETLTFSIENKDTTGAYIFYTVNFNITNIDEQLRNTQLKYKLLQGTTVVGEGDFSTATSNNIMNLVDGNLPAGTSNYTLYIYIDSNEENNTNMMNKNLRGVIEVSAYDSTKTLAGYIKALYLANKDADPVINNNIEYGYASSVNLMNDRLGGTTESLDGGNIRFYGAEETFLENSTGADGQREVGNWEILFAKYGMTPTFSDSEGCETWVTNIGGWNDNVASETGYATSAEFCSTSPKYYKLLKNYIDIGDKTATDISVGNWVSIAGDIGVSTEQECLDLIEKEGIDDTQMQQYYGVTVSQFCSVTTTPAGTPILWRIIGVFDGKLRIRRDESKIGGFSFDTSASDVNGGSGINEWSQADLMKLLNPGYQDLEVGGSLWYNSQSGTCYVGKNNETRACDFSNTGLSDEAKEFIVDQTIYLGGFDTINVFADQAYVKERESNVIQNPGDGIPRTTSWTGKVALIYPSDFGYAADLRNANCQNNLSGFNSCTANWMNGTSWTVSPMSDSANMKVYVSRTLGSTFTYENYGGWPVLTLNSDVAKVSGTGTKDDPYVIG